MNARLQHADLPRRRLVVPTLAAGPARIGGDHAHYVRDVLRLSAGDELTLVDGQGRFATATVIRLGREELELDVGPIARAPALPTAITVALPPPKGERADWVVEKLTEIGVSTIVWLETERTVRRPRQGGSRAKRWQRLAEAAASQCGRATIPAFVGPVAFAEMLEMTAERRVIGDGAGAHHLAAGAGGWRSALLGVGPEGGFARQELDLAATAGFDRVRLGPLTLRSETAAVVGAALLMGLAEQTDRVTP